MFNIYYSNDLDVQKEILLTLMSNRLADPFQSEVVLVQSPGMAQWLKWQIAQKNGVASNIKFPMPASFIWQQYLDNLPDVDAQSQFNKTAMTWRLMRLIPNYLSQPAFRALRHYLSESAQSEQYKLYQLSHKIADLFDQYLVYRPEWIQAWEAGEDEKVAQQVMRRINKHNDLLFQQLQQDMAWQAMLWRALVAEITQETQQPHAIHRASLHHQFLTFLQDNQPKKLPERLFIFGISALPTSYLETFTALAKHCDVHLFFTNGCREYWGDVVDLRFHQRLAQIQRISYHHPEKTLGYTPQTDTSLAFTATEETLFEGHSLLSSWGKLGRDFLYLLTELEQQENVRSIDAYTDLEERHLLSQVQARILNLDGKTGLKMAKNDRTLTFHSCHSPMREVEVLHDYLLHLFQAEPDLTPKEIVVMVADIDRYTPYIQAVFGQKNTSNQALIPFSISDNKLSESDVLIASFLRLLHLHKLQFSAEEVLALLDIPAIRHQFQIELADLEQIHYWVSQSGIRFGLAKQDESQQTNYNAWQAGLERMLLGYAMREENGIWQDSLGFDNSYGLGGQLAGKLAAFIACLFDWQKQTETPHQVEDWQHLLKNLLTNFFAVEENNRATLLYMQEVMEQCLAEIQQTHFEQPIQIDVIAEVLGSVLEDDPNTMKFLAGKVNFCTLLPMRSIPFKVVCLLGMNDADYPRQQTPNSFDLMQYERRKGDRFRRDDDCYLFLEALLSAQDYFYVSFVGRSIIDNQAKEPSVLVSQLLDYLVDKLPEDAGKDWRNELVEQHPMTAFSPENFSKTYRTFANQWLPLACQEKADHYENFIQPIEQAILPDDREITLSELISFVQNPVAFFFRRRLGVYFSAWQESIPDTENFTLDALTQYAINDALLYCDEQASQQLFEQLKIKGILPRGEFGKIYAEKQQQAIETLKQNIAPYLQQDYSMQSVDLLIQTRLGEVRLVGNIDRLYQGRRISWRVGTVRDVHLIEVWMDYLAQCASCPEGNVEAPIYYDKEKAYRFTPLEANDNGTVQAQALAQLTVYLESYLQGYQQIQLVPTTGIKAYLNAIEDQSAVDFEKVLQKLQHIAEGDFMRAGDIYWQRIFAQQRFDQTMLEQINQRTQEWFALMFAHLE
ncbi:exodeoxyribonuclease V subunit gamma [Pasteurella sp. PK-2025]|uniref:exodeoxyribonuclease V subunit gamma n=1 Tax=Pasteurella sp. PK-2025 TaxID=3413133 RepID=UPI003C768394